MSLSMTGFGQSAVAFEGYRITIEVKSVNHRYCEVLYRMPREWSCHEDALKRVIQSRIHRGRIDVYMNKVSDAGQATAALNHAMVQSYLKAAEELATYGAEGKLTVQDLLSLPDVLMTGVEQPGEEKREQWRDLLCEGLNLALDELLAMRSQEGAFLAEDILLRLDRISALHSELEALAPRVTEEYRGRLRQRLESLTQDEPAFPTAAFGMELALFAEKSNVEEELTRLRSHLDQAEQLLQAAGPIGRKLDFLIQEMNREVNTIGSKANHLAMTQHVVELKAELEKIREQAANIE
ncbi:YicC/YloC family endoribonuclease [Paenibacillus sp. JSM ZJ436]|uniref:YicC/YloC family endoribonuclease n=1 Tax=Paenibacillus sp. JSM ZJ436 TaxID=3376190 RepID=UPI00379506F7